jgi:hypothetical protein
MQEGINDHERHQRLQSSGADIPAQSELHQVIICSPSIRSWTGKGQTSQIFDDPIRGRTVGL